MRYSLFRRLLSCVILLVLWIAGHSAHAATAITDFEFALLRPEDGAIPLAFSSDSTIGWSFTPRRDLHVTDLGFFDEGIGLSLRHAVGIWDAESQLLASTEVGGNRSSGMIVRPGDEIVPWPRLHEGDYLYAPIEPLHLRAGETYVVGATVPLFSPYAPAVEGWVMRADSYPLAVASGSLVVDSSVEIREPALVWRGVLGPEQFFGPGVLNFPNVSIDNGAFVGVNFKFIAVPEPCTSFLALSLLLASAFVRRHPNPPSPPLGIIVKHVA